MQLIPNHKAAELGVTKFRNATIAPCLTKYNGLRVIKRLTVDGQHQLLVEGKDFQIV